jgi:hypothetical protein
MDGETINQTKTNHFRRSLAGSDWFLFRVLDVCVSNCHTQTHTHTHTQRKKHVFHEMLYLSDL